MEIKLTTQAHLSPPLPEAASSSWWESQKVSETKNINKPNMMILIESRHILFFLHYDPLR